MQNCRSAPSDVRYRDRRRHALGAARRAHGVGAILITRSADIRYLCGSTEGVGALLVLGRSGIAFTSNMFRVRAQRECAGASVQIPATGHCEAVAEICRKRHCPKLGFQDTTMTVSQHKALAQAAGEALELVPLGDMVVEQRAVKDEDEIAWTRLAVDIAESAFGDLLCGGASFFIGRTERQLAAELDYRMRLCGADRNAFPNGTIVAAGPNSYNCHHVPGDRVVEAGDPVLFDWGAEVCGYRSDITRVVFVRSVPPKLREIYGVVLDAHEAAVAVMGPRVRAHTVDAAARRVIRRAGYEKEFRHGLGHGVGLEIHERPGLGGKPKEGPGLALKPGMIITVEPGIYIEGLGGVRIEDDILVTAAGHERLNSLPRSLEHAVLQ